jgi:uncharacterized repeat protein (TIGR01451 family)
MVQRGNGHRPFGCGVSGVLRRHCDGADPARGNTVTARFSNGNGYVLPEVSSNSVETAVAGAPVLKITASADSDPVAPGSILTYTISVTNSGNLPATAVTAAATLSSLLQFQGASSGGRSSPPQVTWQLGTIPPDSSVTFTIITGVQAAAPIGSVIPFSVSTACQEGAGDSASLNTNTGLASRLVITKAASVSSVAAGGQIDYTINYINTGNLAAHHVVIRDDLPNETALVPGSVTDNGTVADRTVFWRIDSLAAGSSSTIHFSAKVSPIAALGSVIRNTAVISSDENVVTRSNEVLISVAIPQLSILKTAATEVVRPGDTLLYIIVLKNEGDVPITGIQLQDELPAGTGFMNADGGGSLQGDTVRWIIPVLDSATSQTLHLGIVVDKNYSGTSVSNTARATADGVPELSSTAVKDVTARTVGKVVLFDESWQPAYVYNSGQRINIEVADFDRNNDPAAIETVIVVLVNPATNDTETIILTETGPDTGVFRGSIPSTLATTANENGVLTVTPNSRISVTYADPLDAAAVSTASALIDPFGIVFDSFTGAPVSGVVVTLRNWNNTANSCDLTGWPALPPGQINPALPTVEDGRFAFPLVPAGDYCFQVVPPAAYLFPSAVPDTEMPPGFVVGNASRGEKFSLNIGDPPLISDIPIDPPVGQLAISKAASKTTAAVGDLIIYSITLKNNGASPANDVVISDAMPHGITYLSGSTLIDGAASPNPQSGSGATLIWPIGALAPQKSVVITYRTIAGPDSPAGTGINTVVASGMSLGKKIVSNRAFVKVKIAEGVFTTKGTIIGRVFIDRDRDGIPKDNTGVADVILYMEDGTRVITDKSGKFSIAGITPGTHVLRLDETSLPKGLLPKSTNNRFMGDGASQFVDMSPYGLFKANFDLDKTQDYQESSKSPAQTAPAKEGKQKSQKDVNPDSVQISPSAAIPADSAPPVVASNPPAPSGTIPADVPLEKQILTMTPELDILRPQDQWTTPLNSIRILVKAPTDTELTLTVNGKAVDKAQIGMQLKHDWGRVILYEFIDVRLKPGAENIIRAEVRDPFGNLRGEKQIRVIAIGDLAQIALTPDRKEAQADGITQIGVAVALKDKEGRAVASVTTVTVAASLGEILEQDADSAMDGHQVLCKDGSAYFTIIAPRETGDASIQVQAGDVTESTEIFFMPHLRSRFMVGVGEITFGHGQTTGDIGYIQDRTFFGDGAYLKGRGAFFLKDNIYKDFLLTAAYDSRKKESEELFRESDTHLDAEDKYPTYGDESRIGYEALSRDKLYVKVGKAKSFLLYGDYQTDLNSTKLAAYARTFNGLKLEVNTDRFHLRSFGSYTDQTQVVDTIPGRGVSGLYYLTNSQIIEGSERVVIETRDRLQPSRILAKELNSRGADYEIDYGLGSLLFKAPVSSHDADGNPLYIVTTYEFRALGNKYLISGGRGAYKITNWLEAGGTSILEENAISNYLLYGGDLTMKLPRKTTIKTEYVHTQGLFDISNSRESKVGNGWSIEMESQPFKKLTINGFSRKLDDYFSNPSATDAIRGTRKYGFGVAYELAAGLNLKANYLDEEDLINNSSHRLVSFGAVKKIGKTSISANLSYETAENVTPAQPPGQFTPGGLLNGVPFMNAYELPKEATFVTIGAERKLTSKISLSANHKQDFGGEGFFVSQGGVNYQINKLNRFYLREEYAKYEQGTQTRTLIGVESQSIKNTTAYQELRLTDGSAGSRNQQVIGLKNKFTLTKGMTTNIGAEYLRTLNGQKNVNEPDAYALAGALEYLPSDDLKLTGRVEHRHELVKDGTDTYLAEFGAAYKLNPDFSLLVRERYFLEKKGDQGNNHTSRLMMGIAYRPLGHDRFNALGRIEYKLDKRMDSKPASKTDSFILSTEGNFQLSRQLQLMGKYAGKIEKEETFSSYTDLITARIMYDITNRFDIGLESRLLNNYKINARLFGGSAELGYRIIKNLWISGGYSFDEFDVDLAGDSYQGHGPYLKLRFKFDEKTMR